MFARSPDPSWRLRKRATYDSDLNQLNSLFSLSYDDAAICDEVAKKLNVDDNFSLHYSELSSPPVSPDLQSPLFSDGGMSLLSSPEIGSYEMNGPPADFFRYVPVLEDIELPDVDLSEPDFDHDLEPALVDPNIDPQLVAKDVGNFVTENLPSPKDIRLLANNTVWSGVQEVKDQVLAKHHPQQLVMPPAVPHETEVLEPRTPPEINCMDINVVTRSIDGPPQICFQAGPLDAIMSSPEQAENDFRVLQVSESWQDDLRRGLSLPTSAGMYTKLECNLVGEQGVTEARSHKRRCDTLAHDFVSGSQLSCLSPSDNSYTGEAALMRITQAIRRCIALPTDDPLSILDELTSSTNGPVFSAGIVATLDVPVGNIVYPDILELCKKWTVRSSKRPSNFKLSDNRTSSFTLDEVETAVEILTSRPPRRYNHFPAPVFDGKNLLVPTPDAELPGGLRLTTSLRKVVACQPKDLSLSADVSENQSCLSPRPDLYRPRYTKGSANTKLGWCDNCPNGGYHKMKCSSYVYHKNFEHGILANGSVMEDPLLLVPQTIGRNLRWKGLCGICYRWIDIDCTRTGRWGTWFRHYNACSKEYQALRTLLRRTGLNAQMVEMEYCPYVVPEKKRTGKMTSKIVNKN